jgi:hypothetical protein
MGGRIFHQHDLAQRLGRFGNPIVACRDRIADVPDSRAVRTAQ